LLLETGDLVLQVLVALKFAFYVLNVSLKFDLSVVGLLELLAELIKLDAEIPAFFFEVLNLDVKLIYFILELLFCQLLLIRA
jgi:hypothetical protein